MNDFTMCKCYKCGLKNITFVWQEWTLLKTLLSFLPFYRWKNWDPDKRIDFMEITSYLVTSQHNSLSQHSVSLYTSRGNNPTEVKEMETQFGLQICSFICHCLNYESNETSKCWHNSWACWVWSLYFVGWSWQGRGWKWKEDHFSKLQENKKKRNCDL